MQIDWSFPKQVLLTLLLVGVLAGYPLAHYGSDEITKAAIAGGLLATVNVLLGYAAIEYSSGKSMTTFFKYVIGGMGVRMFGLALLLLLLIKVYEFHIVALVASMGVFYVIFLILELLFIQRKINNTTEK